MKKSSESSWKRLDEQALEPISDRLTGLFEFLTPERKERDNSGRKPSSEEESDEYMEDLNKKRKARYEALKEKYKD